jgi:low temperature requirement protein LtrA
MSLAWQTALWAAAAIIDYAGPGWLTRKRLRGLQRVAAAHFVERYGTFIIICLGESIVAIGLGATGRELDAKLVATVATGLLITIGLWWIYFDSFAAVAAERLRSHADPVLAASDAYSYIHLLLVAGVIVFAVGMRHAVAARSGALAADARLALCAGVGLYLLGHLAFRARLSGGVSYEKLAATAALIVLFALGSGLHAWAVAAAAAVLVILLCLAEALSTRT